MKFFQDAKARVSGAWNGWAYPSQEVAEKARAQTADNRYINTAREYNGQIAQAAIVANGLSVMNSAWDEWTGLGALEGTGRFTANFLLTAAFVTNDLVLNTAQELMSVAAARGMQAEAAQPAIEPHEEVDAGQHVKLN